MGLWDEILAPQNLAQRAWVWEGERYVRRSYGETHDSARRVAASLKRRGFGPGSVAAAVITNSPAALQGVLGVWMCGATAASMPIIGRGQSLQDYLAELRPLCDLLAAECLLVEERFRGFFAAPGWTSGPEVVAYETLVVSEQRADIAPPAEDDVMFIQFSSGTTAEPRGIELTGRAIEAQLTLLAERIELDPEREVGLTWLPLSHDMGFFGGVLLAYYTGMRGILSPPERFLRQPWTWFDDCARFGATLTVAPSFAYALAARSSHRRPPDRALSLRLCLMGGEPISLSHIEDCATAFGPHGLPSNAFTPAYGLAEATLAVSLGQPEAKVRSVWVDPECALDGRLSLCDEGAPQATEVVSCGPLLPGFDAVHDEAVGELRVSGPSLAAGYRGQPALTAERFRAGTFATGDVGFLHDGELYVVGRLDDRLIVGGRNLNVSELEAEIAEDGHVRKGSCAVVDVQSNGRQRIVLVAEAAAASTREDILSRARSLAARRYGLRIDDVVVLGEGQFPKTPSGKAQRYRCRAIAAARLTAPTPP